MKPLLVGEANPYQSNEDDAMYFALHPDPPRASGGRLCYFVMGLDERTYLRSYDRIDLCHPTFRLKNAKAKAEHLIRERTPEDVIVACGAKVAAAFGVPYWPFEIFNRLVERSPERSPPLFPTHKVGAPCIVVIPHPSGLNRMWHEPNAVHRARAVLREAGVLQ